MSLQPSFRIEQIEGAYQPGETPDDIRDFLHKHGWMSAATYGLWAQRSDGSEYTWEQAVAYEFYRFITIGGR